jgi:nitrate/TMAO reductase-like tetraheme cytochrome c subunit
MPPPDRISKVVLTIAHLNHDPSDNRDENLAALCQWCHNHHDVDFRQANARETRMTRKDSGRPLLVMEVAS